MNKLYNIKTEETPTKEIKKKKIQKNKKRCFNCRKKVGFYGFKCKCDYVFCSKHRQPDSHECTYDYKGENIKNLKSKYDHVKMN